MDLSKLPRLSNTEAPPAADHARVDPTLPPAGDFEPAMMTSAPAAAYCRCGAPLRAGARFCDSCGASVAGAPVAALPYAPRVDAGAGAEVWISVAIGGMLLFMQPRLLQFVSHKLFGSFFAPYIDPAGVEVPYIAQIDFWSDLGITLFALVLILEGLPIAFARRRGVVMLAFGLTVLTTAYNLGYLLYSFSAGVPLLSVFAIAFGVYIATFQWKLLQATRPASDFRG